MDLALQCRRVDCGRLYLELGSLAGRQDARGYQPLVRCLRLVEALDHAGADAFFRHDLSEWAHEIQLDGEAGVEGPQQRLCRWLQPVVADDPADRRPVTLLYYRLVVLAKGRPRESVIR